MSTRPFDTSTDVFRQVLTAMLSMGVSVRFRADGDSMKPTILSGDTIVVAAVDGAAVERGDIVVYRCGRRLLVHRVVGRIRAGDGSRLHLRGDGKCGVDAPVHRADVVARVVAVERGGRTVRLDGSLTRLRDRVRARMHRTTARLVARHRLARAA